MNTREIIKAALKGCDRQAAADAVGMSIGGFNNLVAGERPYAPKGDTPNFLDRTVDLIDITSATTGKQIILQALAEEFGYMLIANPAIHADQTPAITQVARILKEFSEVIEEFGRANADNKIDKNEAGKLRARWEILKRTAEEFCLACETGVYSKD